MKRTLSSGEHNLKVLSFFSATPHGFLFLTAFPRSVAAGNEFRLGFACLRCALLSTRRGTQMLCGLSRSLRRNLLCARVWYGEGTSPSPGTVFLICPLAVLERIVLAKRR